MMKNRQISESLFQKAAAIKPGGVNNPARSFSYVGGTPISMSQGKRAYICDEDDNHYIDYVMGWGPLMLGHAHPAVVEHICQTTQTGLHFGTPTRMEYQLAQMLVDSFDSIDMIRIVNSGTEAVMGAIRIAKNFTGRSGVVKFIGGYHGWDETILSGSSYNGVLGENKMYLAPFNDLVGIRDLLEVNQESIAALIIEPVAGNMGVIPPKPDFLKGLRALCDEFHCLLIFDEVMTGFRAGYPGAQNRFQVAPDITCLGKIIGGGLPIGAYGGKEEIMSVLAPLGPVYQGGTYSGNPLSASAGVATLNILQHDPTYLSALEAKTARLCSEITTIAHQFGIAITSQAVGGMFTLYFTEEAPSDYESVQTCNLDNFSQFFHGMLDAGIYWPPSQFEAAHLSMAHTDDDIDATIRAARSVFSTWKQ
jgi:glutamate-1-semialdehyde 2,1-aminomutase